MFIYREFENRSPQVDRVEPDVVRDMVDRSTFACVIYSDNGIPTVGAILKGSHRSPAIRRALEQSQIVFSGD